MTKYIYWLKEIRQSDKPAVGGKAANLGDMARGLHVPPGFCLSAQAYYENLKHYGLEEQIKGILDSLDTANIKDLDRISAEISALIINAPVLPAIQTAVVDAYAVLAERNPEINVAVRSSATAEDLVDASFAGQLESFLDVRGIADVMTAVKRCWASVWTARAIHYRNQKGFEHHLVRMAVIVQEMIPSAVSGVMFTANPINNNRHEIRIEAVRGLGEQLVSGHTAGDVYILRKDEVNVDIVSKTVADPGKGQMLTDYDIRELAHNGLKIELFYEDYQDVEWAFNQGQFFYLQSRPVTTLADEELPEIDLNKMSSLQREVVDWVAERFPEPIYPIDGVVVKVLFMAQFEAMKSFGYKIEDMDWTRVDRGIFPEFFAPPKINPGLKRLWLYLRLGKTLKSDPAAEWAGEQIYLLDTLKKLKGRDISKLPFEIIFDYINEGFNHLHFFTVMRYNYFTQNRIPSALLLGFLKLVFKEDAVLIYENLLAGSDNMTLEINKALMELAHQARLQQGIRDLMVNAPLTEIDGRIDGVQGGTEFRLQLNSFLEKYGERETTMGLGGIASPTWQDSPEVVFGIIRGMLLEEPGADKAREEARKRRVREAEDKLAARMSKGLLAVLPIKSLMQKIIRHARSFTAFRENSHYDVTRSMHVFRILFHELGERFIRQGLLADPADIIYLSYFEIKDIIFTIYHSVYEVNLKELAAKIEGRKAEQDRRMKRWSDRTIQFDAAGALQGAPASQGLITGPARIIKDPRDFHRIRRGDILVAPYTNPAWTPLFTTATGLVVETGGAASHAAIIAREYGIPAVLGVTKATELFEDGEIITVNGTSGMVYRGQGVES